MSTAPDRPAPSLYLPLLFAALALAAANLPYLLGVLWTPRGAHFTGLTYNADDGAVYLSWIRQAMEGRLTLHNRFTTEPQHDLAFNLFFLLLGNIAHVLHLSPPVVYAGARVVCGALLLAATWRLVTTFLTDSRARLLAYVFVCCAAGFGFGSDFDPSAAYEQPIDRWQPEAITFLSLYYTPLFTAALALMSVWAASFYRAEQTGRIRDLVPALIAGLLIGNFHSYDILQLWAFAAAYRVVTDAAARRTNLGGWIRLALAGAAMLPTAGYQFWAIQREAVFHARVFDTATLSPSLQWVLLGFGLPLLLAALAPFLPRARAGFAPNALRMLAVWAVVAVAISYAPHVAFQRKLLMGAHLPLCLLAGASLAALTSPLSGSLPALVSVFAVLVTVPSNVRFLLRDTARLRANVGATQYRPYLSADEYAALDYLAHNARAGDAVLVCPDMRGSLLPYLGVYVPAYSPASAYCAHWSETADFAGKLKQQTHFFRTDVGDDERAAFLAANPAIRYVLYAKNVKDGITDAAGNTWGGADFVQSPPAPLAPVYENNTLVLFRVR